MFGNVNILDTNNNTLASDVYVATGTDATWTKVTRPLPPVATGQVIVVEFVLDSDNFQPGPMAGWYIDDVGIVEPERFPSFDHVWARPGFPAGARLSVFTVRSRTSGAI